MGHTKTKLNNGETTLGAWITIPHPAIIEVLQGHQFDWVALDLEHAPFDNRTIYEMVRASNGWFDVLARLPSCDPVAAKQALDAGCSGIIVPNVTSIEQGHLINNMAKYPPQGKRSMAICRANNYGRSMANYHTMCNDDTIVVIMIEEYCDQGEHELAKAAGADAVLIGPYDLSCSMGIAAQFCNPKFQYAIEDICNTVKDTCAPGIHVASVDPELVAEYKKRGFRFIACGLDTEMLRFGAKNALST